MANTTHSGEEAKKNFSVSCERSVQKDFDTVWSNFSTPLNRLTRSNVIRGLMIHFILEKGTPKIKEKYANAKAA